MSITRDEIIRILLRTEGTEDAAKLRSELGRLVDATDDAARRNQSFAAALDQSKAALVASAAAVYGLVKAFSGAAKASSDLQTAIAAIGTIAADADLDALTGQVQALSREFGGTAATQAKALYEIIAAGVSDSTQAMEVLATANKLAIGGLADVETAASGLVATLNSYGLSADQATRVSDAFFVSAAAGNATIEELASTIGSVAPLAASVGVSIEELAASVGALTAGGLSTSQAMTQVQSMLTAVVKPTAQAAKAAEELGINFTTAEIRAKGFTAWLQEVSAAAGGNETVLAQLFGRVEGLQGVLALTGNQADSFAAALSDMTDAAGATERAFERLSDTPAQRMERFRASVDGLKVAIGNVVTALAPVLDGIAAVINAFTELPVPIQTVIASLGLLTVAVVALGTAWKSLGPVMLAARAALGPMGAAISTATTAVGGLSGALAVIGRFAWPAALASGLYAIGAAAVEAWNASRRVEEAQERQIKKLRDEIWEREQIAGQTRRNADLQIQAAAELAQLSRDDLTHYREKLIQAERYNRAQIGILVRQRMIGEGNEETVRALSAASQRARDLRDAMVEVNHAIKETPVAVQRYIDLGEAFKTLGYEAKASANEIAEVGKETLRAFESIVATAESRSTDIINTYSLALRKMVTQAEVKALGAALLKAFTDGRISLDEFMRKSEEAAAKLRELSGSADQVAASAQKTADANKKVSESVREVGAGLIDVEKSANTADKAIQEMTTNNVGSSEALAGVLNGMRDSLRQYGDAAVQEFDRIFQSMASVDNRWQTTGMTLTQILGKVADVANAVAERHKIAQEAAERHARSMAYLSEHSGEAAQALADMGYSLDDIRSGAVSASDALLALGNQRMHRLRPELEGVASALEGIEQKAADAVASLAAMNQEYEKARLQRLGDDKALAEIEFQEELRRIKEYEAAAGAAGAAEAAEARRRAEAEHQARLREIREREKEEKRANRDIDRERQTSSGGGAGGGGRGSGLGGSEREVERVIRVEIPDIGNVDVADEDSAAVLERGLQAVARAARAGRRAGG